MGGVLSGQAAFDLTWVGANGTSVTKRVSVLPDAGNKGIGDLAQDLVVALDRAFEGTDAWGQIVVEYPESALRWWHRRFTFVPRT